MKTKVVINTCYGGFGLSEAASEMLNNLKGYAPNDTGYINPEYGGFGGPRHDTDLVKVVEKLGKAASAKFGELTVVEIDEVRYIVDEYDGYESITTPFSIDWVIVDSPEARKEFPQYFL